VAEPVLQFKEVVKVYPGENPVYAVNQVSFSLPEGSFAALIGPSGSGKTSLLNMASGLDHPTQGEVWVNGQNITQLSSTELCRFRREHLGFVFQSYNLFPVLTAAENVEYTCILRGESRKIAREKGLVALKQVGLEDKAQRLPSQLSGGQQQRVAVARALASDPAIILADEPTANLDSRTALDLIDLFERLNSDLKKTFLFSTHDHRLVERIKTRLEMKDGKLSPNQA
jgi:putative ABC transport system ATP-binding protein